MSEEIKEILDELSDEDNYGAYDSDKMIYTYISQEKSIKLLDYITNLQTIEQQYSAVLSENAELQQENERLKAINNEYERLNKEKGRGFTIKNVETYDINQLLDYKSRCDKAIDILEELIAEFQLNDYITDFDKKMNKPLNILQGSDKE